MSSLVRLSRRAHSDLDEIWAYTIDQYDLRQAVAYLDLIGDALDDIAENPDQPVARKQPHLGPHFRSYHIALSKRRGGSRVGRPRHVVFYTLAFEGELHVIRILHDQMKSERHLFEE